MATKHVIIPDVQNRPGDDTGYLTAIGKMIVDERPDVVVVLGDFSDMESLCSFDKGKKSFEGRRVLNDIQSAKAAINKLVTPLQERQRVQRETKHAVYRPRLVLTLGNHEHRIVRAAESSPELDGLLTLDSLGYAEAGFTVHAFLEVVTIDGVAYTHYLKKPAGFGPIGGTVDYRLRQVHNSFVMGHIPGFYYAEVPTITGRVIQGVVAGSCYNADMPYQGPQGQTYWRGVVVLDDVRDGNFDVRRVSLARIEETYK